MTQSIDWRGAPRGSRSGQQKRRDASAARPAYARPSRGPRSPGPAGAAPLRLPGVDRPLDFRGPFAPALPTVRTARPPRAGGAKMIRILPLTDANLAALAAGSRRDLERVLPVAARIVGDIRRRGEAALDAWRRRLDHRDGALPPLRIPLSECRRAWRGLAPGLRQALQQAHDHIQQMAEWQKPAEWRRAIAPGVRIGQIVRPLASVGCYVPGGRHPLPSTLLMTAVPARVAGVARIVAVCPQPAEAVLAAAWLAGVSEVYCVGGAQAVAALAYGAGPIAAVDKIVGPGNVYVTAAKRLVWPDCAIDFPAGPTEVLYLAPRGANPEFAAADLIAQAEHDPDASAWLIVFSAAQARDCAAAIARQLAEAPQRVARTALRRRGTILVARTRRQAMAAANRLAAEHITLPGEWLADLQHAGSAFLGEYAPQAAGDYLSGTNHVLPTGAGARSRGGLSVVDFLKVITVQELTRSGLAGLGPAITTLAHCEGLDAHARSVAIRLSPTTP
jgi:histidinol dehydrogenase